MFHDICKHFSPMRYKVRSKSTYLSQPRNIFSSLVLESRRAYNKSTAVITEGEVFTYLYVRQSESLKQETEREIKLSYSKVIFCHHPSNEQ